jgi:geranylgeranyl diphosphate synthase, type II
LAGDGLLTQAFHLMSSPEVVRALAPILVSRLIHEISHAAGVAGLVGGQALDLQAEGRDVDIATVEYIHVRKTGALILVATRVGAQIGGATPKELRKITRYAEFLGLAFQIVDDLLDAQGQSGAEGSIKTLEREKRKATYPAVVGLAAAKARARELLQSSLKEIKFFGRDADPLRGIACAIVDQAR